MTTIYLVRHGETDWNRAKRIQGSTDIDLNAVGRRQAETAGLLLSRRDWDLIVASPLSRARETATIIADQVGLPEPLLMAELVERRYGEAEGLNYQQVDDRFPGDTIVPGRESREEVTERVIPALLSLSTHNPTGAIIVVSHGGVIRSVLNEIDPENTHGTITNGSIHSLRVVEGTLELIAFDDPIDELSLQCGAGDIEDQNAIELRETTPR